MKAVIIIWTIYWIKRLSWWWYLFFLIRLIFTGPITFPLCFNFEFWISLFTKLKVKLAISTKYFFIIIKFLSLDSTWLLMNYLELLITKFLLISLALWIVLLIKWLKVFVRVGTMWSLFLVRADNHFEWFLVLIKVRSLIFRAFHYLYFSSVLNLLRAVVSVFHDLALVNLGFISVICLSLGTGPHVLKKSFDAVHCFC